MRLLKAACVKGGCLAAATLLLSGCATAKFEEALPNGTIVRAHAYRCLWKTENFDLYVLGADGQIIKVRLGKSATDPEATAAVTKGITEAIIQALTKIP